MIEVNLALLDCRSLGWQPSLVDANLSRYHRGFHLRKQPVAQRKGPALKTLAACARTQLYGSESKEPSGKGVRRKPVTSGWRSCPVYSCRHTDSNDRRCCRIRSCWDPN